MAEYNYMHPKHIKVLWHVQTHDCIRQLEANRSSAKAIAIHFNEEVQQHCHWVITTNATSSNQHHRRVPTISKTLHYQKWSPIIEDLSNDNGNKPMAAAV